MEASNPSPHPMPSPNSVGISVPNAVPEEPAEANKENDIKKNQEDSTDGAKTQQQKSEEDTLREERAFLQMALVKELERSLDLIKVPRLASFFVLFVLFVCLGVRFLIMPL